MLDDLLSKLADATIIAVDTEFFRETTYYPKLALVQIATDSIVACIDPIAFDAKSGLKKILCDKNITKIFHSCSQDLEVLFYYLDEIPKPIYDTQIANALLTDHHQIGYAKLVENELNIQLDKSQTRTNWLQRPLTTKQIQYAGDDVLYLYQLHHLLDKKLKNNDRQTWFAEESVNLIPDGNNFQVAIDKLWQRVKGASRLSRDKLAIVQEIAVWREKVAQKTDKTRRKILADDIIIQIAIEPPKDKYSLEQYITQRFNIADEDQQQLLNAINTALQSPENDWPDNRFNVFDNTQKSLLKNLQLLANTKAEELSISYALLCSKKDLEQLLLFYTNQDDSNCQSDLNISRGWRLHCIGQQLIDTIKASI